MIVATKSVDALIKGIVKPEDLMISRIESIVSGVQLDPSLSVPSKEMFVISNDDVKNPKIRKELAAAVRAKHPKAIIMYINKLGKDIPDIEKSMFDSYLSRPKPVDVREAFNKLVQDIEEKSKFDPNASVGDPEAYKPPVPAAEPTSVPEAVDDNPVTLEVPVEEEKPVVVESSGNALVDRIRSAENYAQLMTVAKEVNAANIVREISEANVTFRQSENYVNSLSENIIAILANPEYDTTTQLSKVRAILHDRAYTKAKTNSIIEQSVESIVIALVDKAREEVTSRTSDMNEKILRALQTRSSNDACNVRLSTIIEERSKLLLDLNTMDLEIKNLAGICNKAVNDTVENIISDSVSTTGSPILDSQMKAQYGEIVPENLLDVLDVLFSTGKESCDEFGKLSNEVNSVVRKLYQMLALYQEETEILADTIRYMRASKVEDTIVANTIMKKTGNLYVVSGAFDTEAFSYLIAKHHSRKTGNVMMIDLTGSGTIQQFGINATKYSDFMEKDFMEDKFHVVSVYDDPGVSISSVEDCQRLSARLLHYAKHYTRIHLVCTDNQREIIDFFKSDVLTVNYIVDCYPTSLNDMKTCIAESKIDNTAYRTVLVNYISDSANICKELNILDRKDMQLAMCKAVPSIRYCALHKQDPYDVESVVSDCEEVLRVC